MVALVGAALLAVSGCASGSPGSSGSTPPTSSQPAVTWAEGEVPTPEQLAAVLLVGDDLGAAWGPLEDPRSSPSPFSGVVPEDQRALLPGFETCARAPVEFSQAADGLRWLAFTHLVMTPQDPIDLAAGDRAGHMVFAQEFLLAQEPDQVADTFGALRDGLAACLGPMEEDADGHAGVGEAMALPPLGDEAYGVLYTVREPGPDSTGVWHLRDVLVRDGPVLMRLQVVEITLGAGVTEELGPTDVDAILTAASDRLG